MNPAGRGSADFPHPPVSARVGLRPEHERFTALRDRERQEQTLGPVLADYRARQTADIFAPPPPPRELPKPVNGAQTANPLRPTWIHQMVGQQRLRGFLVRLVDNAILRDQPLDHVLLVGSAGTGKSTIAHVIGNELGRDVYQVEAPASHGLLMDLREVMHDGDILFIDEIHQQAWGDRRGRSGSTAPEVLFSVMEDHVIVGSTGVLPFPRITVVGATTDEGQLSDPFVARFPIRPALAPYDLPELAEIAKRNAKALGFVIHDDAAISFAAACRGVPRQINSYVKNAASIGDGTGIIDTSLASEVLFDLNNVTVDGLTPSMQKMLLFLYTSGVQQTKAGKVYRASVNSIATATGHGRDTKAIQLRVEPYLIERGFITVVTQGRMLTPAGIQRAEKLTKGR